MLEHTFAILEFAACKTRRRDGCRFIVDTISTPTSKVIHTALSSAFLGSYGLGAVENPELRVRHIRQLCKGYCPRSILHDGRAQLRLVRSRLLGHFLPRGFHCRAVSAGTTAQAVQFGFSLLLWGAIVRTVLVWHITVGQFGRALWGIALCQDEHTRNNFCVGIISGGEGWHNNHHADPRAARHGRRWWELDDTYLVICFLAMVGLARNVIMPSAPLTATGANEHLATRAYAEMAA